MEKKSANVFGLATKDGRELAPVDTTKSQMMAQRKAILNAAGEQLIRKSIEIALDDEHPGQSAQLTKLLDRLMPASEFEKLQGAKTAIQINITGIDSVTVEGDAKEVKDE